MNSRFSILNLLAIALMSVMVVACQDTIPNRSTITPGSSVDTECEEGQTLTEVADESEIPEDKEKIETGGKIYYCKDDTITRPTKAISWKADLCACKDSAVVTSGNCASFCSGRNTNSIETLFANFTVSEAISLGGFGSVHGWCTAIIPGDTQNPSCQLEAKDNAGNVIPLEVSIAQNSNSLTANIESLSYDKTYLLTLKELSSGAVSETVQIIKYSKDVTDPVLGPLKNAPISQYTCMVREYSTDDSTGAIYYETAYRLHFYYNLSNTPAAIPAGNSHLICHDIFTHGMTDDASYDRFENKPGIFNLWDNNDPRFYDTNGNGTAEVNELIAQKAKHFGATIPAGTNFFSSFTWPGSPNLSDDAGNEAATTTPLGYYMAPWIDTQTYKSYCLNDTHYNSNNALFKAMRDVLQVQTEGLYVGEKAAETVVVGDEITTGYKDYILIRETDLKAVWFYMKNGTPTAPTEENVASNTIFFYYPLNKQSPFVRSSTQRLFRVRSACELSNSCGSNNGNNSGSTDTGASTPFPPHDRKIGCVPKF